MTDLSPQAQAVLDAFNREAKPEPHHQREAIAAALRAAAQLKFIPNMLDEWEVIYAEGWDSHCNELLAIAAELEGDK